MGPWGKVLLGAAPARLLPQVVVRSGVTRGRGRLRGRRRPGRRDPVTRRWSGPLREPSPELRQPRERVWREPGPAGVAGKRGLGRGAAGIRRKAGGAGPEPRSLRGSPSSGGRTRHAWMKSWRPGVRPRRWPETVIRAPELLLSRAAAPFSKTQEERGKTHVLSNPTYTDTVIGTYQSRR